MRDEVTEVLNDRRTMELDQQYGLGNRVERVFDEAREERRKMDLALESMRESEMRAELANAEPFMAAKNGEQRQLLLHSWLGEDADHSQAKDDYAAARRQYRLLLLECEELKVLASLADR